MCDVRGSALDLAPYPDYHYHKRYIKIVMRTRESLLSVMNYCKHFKSLLGVVQQATRGLQEAVGMAGK